MGNESPDFSSKLILSIDVLFEQAIDIMNEINELESL